MLLWGAISSSLTRRVSTTQQHQRDIVLAVFVSAFSPRLLTSEELGSDGWDGVTRLKIKVDIWRVKMICFQKGIFIYTSSRGGLEKKKKKKRKEELSFFQACFEFWRSLQSAVSQRFCLVPLITQEWWREFKALPLLWKEQLWHLK